MSHYKKILSQHLCHFLIRPCQENPGSLMKQYLKLSIMKINALKMLNLNWKISFLINFCAAIATFLIKQI